MCSRWAPRRCRHIWIRRAKFSMTLPHSSLGIALIAAVIAAFRSGIVWGFVDSSQGVCYPRRVHVTWQQKMCLVRKPDIVKKVWHSVDLVAKPLAHDHSLPHVVRCKLLFTLYPARIHVEICDQNYPRRLPVDSKLLTSSTHRLAWAVDKSLWQQQRCVVSLMISVVQSVIVC